MGDINEFGEGARPVRLSKIQKEKETKEMKTLIPFRALVILGLPLLALLLGVSVLAQDGSVLVANWAHFGYDSAYTAHNTLESTIGVTNVTELERLWGIGCDDGYFSVISRSPAVHEGRLYTSGAGSKLRAYTAHGGRMLWEFGDGNYGWAPQPVVSQDGTVFYMEGSYPTHLYAVDGTGGNELWEAPLAFDMGYNDTALVTVDESNALVYVVENPFMGDGKLYALDKQSGAIVWYKSQATDDAAFKGDYVLLREGKIFAVAEVPMEVYPFEGDHVLRIDASTHDIEIVYDRPTPENYYDIEHYSLCNDTLVVDFDYQYDADKLLVAYTPITSTIAWQKTFSETTGTIACNEAKNQIYVPTDPYLYALDATTGAEVWKYTGYGALYNPSIANGVVYLLSDTNMYALDEASGERLFSYPLGYEAYETTQVAIADGMLYFSGNGGTCDLYALGLRDEKVLLPLLIR
jgi:outer membrane protein assembly factor BamB